MTDMEVETKAIKNERVTVRLNSNDIRKMNVLQIELGGITKSQVMRTLLSCVYNHYHKSKSE